jgi:hypothetical protein
MTVEPRKDRSKLKLVAEEEKLNGLEHELNFTKIDIAEVKKEQEKKERIPSISVNVYKDSHGYLLQWPVDIPTMLPTFYNKDSGVWEIGGQKTLPNANLIHISTVSKEYLELLKGRICGYSSYTGRNNKTLGSILNIDNIAFYDPACGDYHKFPIYPRTYFLCQSKSSNMPRFKITISSNLDVRIDNCN